MTTSVVRATGRSPAGRLFVALWGGLAVVDVARPTLGALVTATLVVGLAAACGSGQPPLAAAAIAVTGWLVIDGFVEHRYGELGFGPTSWVVLAVALVVVLLVSTRTSDGASNQDGTR
jgi:hypothetical protein